MKAERCLPQATQPIGWHDPQSYLHGGLGEGICDVIPTIFIPDNSKENGLSPGVKIIFIGVTADLW